MFLVDEAGETTIFYRKGRKGFRRGTQSDNLPAEFFFFCSLLLRPLPEPSCPLRLIRERSIGRIESYHPPETSKKQNASILVGLLWCLALLSMIVIGLLHTARLDLLVVKNHGDRIQAHYLALAGVEKAKALLYHDMLERRGTAKNHTGHLYDDAKEFRAVGFGRGSFNVFRRGGTEEEGMVFGVSDEESRLNLNTASPEELTKLNGITPDVVAAIVDWRDANNAVTPSGAEAEYYSSLQPPSLPRNGPFQTTRELLMVRGITSDLLLGDGSDNEVPDLNESNSGLKNSSDSRDRGWAGLLCVNSSVENLNASGKDRVNIQSADEKALSSIKGISAQLAKVIIAYRNQKQFESIADLLDVTEVTNQPAPPTPFTTSTSSARSRSSSNPSKTTSRTTTSQATRTAQPSGPRLISDDLFMEIADDVTVSSDSAQEGLININTASLDVLICLEGIERDLAQAIISHRKSDGFFPNVAALLKVPGMNREIFKQIAPRLTARSETFRIRCEGKVTSTGARQCLEVIVHVTKYDIKTLSYREDL